MSGAHIRTWPDPTGNLHGADPFDSDCCGSLCLTCGCCWHCDHGCRCADSHCGCYDTEPS